MQADQLVGRAAALAVLDEALAVLDRGRSATVEIVGEPGIGKTRLVTELRLRAEARGHIVLSGSASEFEQDLPFWPFVDALDEYVRSLDPRALAGMAVDVRGELGHVLPSLPVSPGHGQVGDERYLTHRAVRRLLEEIAAVKPLVLTLDDLHWADSGSVELLGTLLRRPPQAPVLIVVAVRPHQAPGRLASALERAERGGGLHRLELSALSAAEARALLGATIGPGAVDALYADSGGNPFYLQQLARSRQNRRLCTDPTLADVPVPPAVAAALLQELALLDDADRRMLEGAAVAGDPFDIDVAAAAADASEAAAMDALDELLRRDLVRPTEVPRRFRFRHPLVRRAVYASAPGGWRLGAHGRAATALARRGAPAPVRAHHIDQSAHSGDLGAVAVLREAAEALAARSPAGAARWFAAALRLLPHTAPATDRIALGTALAAALASSGRFADAHRALLDSLAAVPPEAVTLRVRLLADCAGIEQMLGNHQTAHVRLLDGLKRLPDPGSPEAVGLMLELAADCLYRMEYRPMQDWSQRALDIARPLGEPLLTARAAARLAFAGTLVGSVPTAEAGRVEAAALVDDMTDEELAGCLERAVTPLAAASLYLDRYADADRYAERMLAVARATGRDHLPTVLYWVGAIRLANGRLSEAAEVLDTAVEICHLTDNPSASALSLSGRSFVATAAGDADVALAAAQDAADLLGRRDDSLIAAWVGYALATALLSTGDPARAANILVETGGGIALPLLPAVPRIGAGALRTQCLLALDKPDEAVRVATLTQRWAEELGLQTARAVADRAAATVALHQGDAVHAAHLALRAAATAEAVGAVVDAATARALAGRALASAAEPQRAAEQLQAASATFAACAAPRRRDAIEHELRRLGHRGPHRRSGPVTGSGPLDALTQRELQVARLVLDRRTNAEIAAHLFLSHKTVETHLRNIFHKLGVFSRTEVARTVERVDRADQTP